MLVAALFLLRHLVQRSQECHSLALFALKSFTNKRKHTTNNLQTMCKFTNNAKHSRIDKCMSNIVRFINEHSDYETLACCCGHGKYPPSIVAKPKLIRYKGHPVELFSFAIIPRTRRFYKKDKQGMYYIPEVLT